MPFDTIKLDKSFIDSIAEGNNLNIEIIFPRMLLKRSASEAYHVVVVFSDNVNCFCK